MLRAARTALLLAWAAVAVCPAAAQEPELPVPIPRGGVRMAEPLRIHAEPVACLLAGWFPVLRARVEAPVAIDRARLRFRPEPYALWYEVPLQPTSEGYMAVLPKPRPSARRVHYYFDVRAGGARARTDEGVARVVEQREECSGPVASSVEMASVPVAVPRGAPAVPPVPPGFVPAGAVRIEPVSGAKSHLETLLVLGGLGVVAGGIAAIPNRQAAPQSTAVEPSVVVLLNSAPPPGSTLSLGSSPMLAFRLSVRPQRTVGRGDVRVMLYRAAEGPFSPCAIVTNPHGGFDGGRQQDIVVSGPLLQARPCGPVDRLRIDILEGGGSRTAITGDWEVAYSIVP